jgi:YbgC/YbaW family acyl-CoA thioester hydrolase
LSAGDQSPPAEDSWLVRYTESYRVPFGDTDAAGIVFYPNYFRWFDRVTHELFRSMGQELVRWGAIGEGPVIVETGCRPMAALRYDETVQLEAGIAEVRERSFRIEHRVTRALQTTTTGYEVRVWARLTGDALDKIAIPADLKRALSGGQL